MKRLSLRVFEKMYSRKQVAKYFFNRCHGIDFFLSCSIGGQSLQSLYNANILQTSVPFKFHDIHITQQVLQHLS